MSRTFLLGPILFEGFELPASITWGGAQSLTVHKLPGGIRVIDAMGRDDSEITWSGIFSGPNAAARARAIDLMRADGRIWPLIWDSFFYSVVIAQLEPDYRSPNWIPYRLTCKVLRDEAESAVEQVISLATDCLADLAAAASFTPALDLSAPTAGLAPANATTNGSAAYTTASIQLAAAAGTANASLAATGATLEALPTASAAALATASDLAGQAAGLAAARGYLQRASLNLTNAST